MIALQSKAIVSIQIIDNEDISPLRAILNSRNFVYFMTGLMILFSLIVKLGQAAEVWRGLIEANQVIIERVFIELFKLVWY